MISTTTIKRRLGASGLLQVAERIAADHNVTLDGVLRLSKAPDGSRVGRARIGLWLTLSEFHGLSTTEIGKLTGRGQSTIANALSRTWAWVRRGNEQEVKAA